MIKCKFCEFTVINSRFTRLLNHELTHLNMFIYNCDQCDYKTNVNDSFLRHVKSHKQSHRCNICHIKLNKFSANLHYKNAHNKRIVKQNERYRCKYCIETRYFHRLFKLNVHLANIHNIYDDTKGICDICNKGHFYFYNVQYNNKTYHMCHRCNNHKKKLNSIEYQVKEFIQNNFDFPFQRYNQVIHGNICSSVRPDILFASHDRIIIIEIDEFAHCHYKQYSYEYNLQRIKTIKNEFDSHIPLIVIHFNPNKLSVHDSNYNFQNRLHELLHTLQIAATRSLTPNIFKNNTNILVYYLFFPNHYKNFYNEFTHVRIP